jgi:hypothetical protein
MVFDPEAIGIEGIFRAFHPRERDIGRELVR